MATNGPLPTHLIFLNSLPSYTSGTKVRFLGCVTSYNTQCGVLELIHNYPTLPSSWVVRALVDVNVIVETMKREELDLGAWLNIVGYVQRCQCENIEGVARITVQAIMIWSAGNLRLGEYEQAVDGRTRIDGNDAQHAEARISK